MDQLRAVRAAVLRLVRAHVDLARTEISEIADEVKRLAGLLAVSLGCLLLLGLFLPIGGLLFLGEWIFGSIGWGLLHGILLLVAVAIEAALLGFAVDSRRVGIHFGLALLIGVVVGVVLGLDLTNRGWSELGARVLPDADPASRPLLIAVIGMAIVGGVVGLVLAWRAGGGGAGIGGLIGGAIAGALLGAFTAITFGGRVGAAVGVAAGLIAWPTLTGIVVARRGIDTEALKARFWPSTTIETAKETIEWVRERTPLGPRS
jgi:hypothetical protein